MSTPKKFQRKPVEAIQLTEKSRQEIAEWLGESAWFYLSNGDSELYVDALLGPECATEGDFIIKRHDGEIEVWNAETFAAFFDPAE